MKQVIILPDGAADEPLDALAGRTCLEAAAIPNMDWIAQQGEQGQVITVPDGFIPGTDVATLSLLGYDPHTCYSGRAPIEAVARGLEVHANQIVFRCNFVTIADGKMADFTAGHISNDEASELIVMLNRELGDHQYAFHAGVSYRNLMIADDAASMDLVCTPPHDISEKPVQLYWPKGRGHHRVMTLMDRAATYLKNHPVNIHRRQKGQPLVTNIWLWGQGRPTPLESFKSKYGLTAAVITGVDIIRGLALSSGMELIDVPGATGYIDTDYAAKGQAAIKALEHFDVVIVHIEAADEAGHMGDAVEKIRALEKIDALVVDPVLRALKQTQAWRLLVAPDHPTPVSSKAHSAEPPPFCFAGTGVDMQSHRPFSEREAKACGNLIPGTELMRKFLWHD